MRQDEIERSALGLPPTTGHDYWHADHPEILITVWIAAGVRPTGKKQINTVKIILDRLVHFLASWLRNLSYALALTTADDFVDAAPRPFVTSNVKATSRNVQSGLQNRTDDHNINKRFLTRADWGSSHGRGLAERMAKTTE